MKRAAKEVLSPAEDKKENVQNSQVKQSSVRVFFSNQRNSLSEISQNTKQQLEQALNQFSPPLLGEEDSNVYYPGKPKIFIRL